MATFKKFNKDKRPKRNTQSLLFKRKRFCRFTVAGVEEIDYKDVDILRDFIGENGRSCPRCMPRNSTPTFRSPIRRSTFSASCPAGSARRSMARFIRGVPVSLPSVPAA